MSKPTLQYAVFCNDIVQRNKKTTIIGITDVVKGKIRWDGTGPAPKKFSPPIKHPFTLAVGLVDANRGKHKIWMVAKTPSGDLEESSHPVQFEVKNKSGITCIKLNGELDIIENGVYQFHILLDGEPIKEIELLVAFDIVYS